MHIYSQLGPQELDTIAMLHGIETYNMVDRGAVSRGKHAGKRHVSLVLRPIAGSDAHRAERNGRRLWAVDWEGHRAFMADVFERDPDATIDSALARYNGADEFEQLHRRTSPDMNTGYRGKVTA